MSPPVTAKKGTYPDMLRLPSPTKDLEGMSDIPDLNSCEKPGQNGAITGRKYMSEIFFWMEQPLCYPAKKKK